MLCVFVDVCVSAIILATCVEYSELIDIQLPCSWKSTSQHCCFLFFFTVHT